MKKLIFALLLLWPTISNSQIVEPFFMEQPKIYDCFLFFNELDILEIRLNELYDHVDHFVLVESEETFRGNVKPLYFDENKERFIDFSDKIIHIIVKDHFDSENPWPREFYQRNHISKGLISCQDDDIIFISDVDEIPRSSKIPEIVNHVQFLGPVNLQQTLYRHCFNIFESNDWKGTVICKYEYLKNRSPQELRQNLFIHPTISNAGWHFSSMGGLDRWRTKLESFSHFELDTEEWKSETGLNTWILERCRKVKIDQSYPKFIFDNEEYFKSLNLIKE